MHEQLSSIASLFVAKNFPLNSYLYRSRWALATCLRCRANRQLVDNLSLLVDNRFVFFDFKRQLVDNAFSTKSPVCIFIFILSLLFFMFAASGCLRGAFGVPSGCLRGAFGVPSGCLRGAFGVPSGCLWGAFGLPLGCLSGAFGVPLGWFPAQHELHAR